MWKDTNKITTQLTLADLYLVVFAPSKMNGSDDNTILYSKESKYYEANKSVDKDNNGISKKELAARAYSSFSLGKENKESSFECGSNNQSDAPMNAKDIVTYRIYEDGKIEKHIPKVLRMNSKISTNIFFMIKVEMNMKYVLQNGIKLQKNYLVKLSYVLNQLIQKFYLIIL